MHGTALVAVRVDVPGKDQRLEIKDRGEEIAKDSNYNDGRSCHSTVISNSNISSNNSPKDSNY